MVMFIIVLINLLVTKAYVMGDPLILSVIIKPTENGAIDAWSCESNGQILPDNEQAYIDFKTVAYNIRDLNITCRSSNDNSILMMSTSTKDKKFKRHSINKITPEMHGRYDCNILPIMKTCSIYIRVSSKELWTVKINDVVVNTTQSQTAFYNWTVRYDFYENELARVDCGKNHEGHMEFRVKDETTLDFKLYWTTNINMLMRIRNKNDGQYIDCYHEMSGMVSIVRIMLKPKPNGTNDDFTQINGQVWSPRPSDIIYRYIEGENANISCTQSGVKSAYYLTPKASEERLYCLNNSEDKIIVFSKLDTKGVQGLHSSNIIFWYTNWMNCHEIHYEYEEKQTLNLTWMVQSTDTSVMHAVFWKNNLLMYVGKLEKKYIQITLNKDDHLSVIKFQRNCNATQEEIRVVLHMIKKDTNLQSVTNYTANNSNIYKFYVPAVVLFCVLIIILISVILYIKHRKTKTHLEFQNAAAENFYENPYEECGVFPFPAHWDTYATTMERTEPDLKSIQDLYSKPIPKSERVVKVKDTYPSSSPSNTDDEILYHDIQFEAEPNGSLPMVTSIVTPHASFSGDYSTIKH